MQDFPVLSQIYNEVGTVATVVDKIDRITAFIEAFTGEEGPPSRRLTTPERPVSQPGGPPAAAGASARVAAPPDAPPTVQPAEAAPAQAPPEVPTTAPPAASEEEIGALYEELFIFVEEVSQAAQGGQPFSVDRGFLLVPRIVDIPGALDVLYRRAIFAREGQDEHGMASIVVLHSVNVAIYALKIGEGLGYNRNQLVDLGVAALVHDVGMVTLPPDLFTKGQFTKQDLQTLQDHPNKAREILLQLGEKYGWLADVAHQEHEREDGSGYPQGLKNGAIHEYAKVVGMADMYAGLTRHRLDRRGLLPFEAVKEIIQSQKQRFDPRLVRILLNKLSAFPVGSNVKLNSGAVGIVVETDETFPLRPSIRILRDAQGRQIEDRVVNLREYPILHITDAILDEDTR